MLSLKWRDKRDVTMLSTYHNDGIVTKNRRLRAAQGRVEDIQKPKVVEDYKKNMGGMDKSKWLLQFIHNSQSCVLESSVPIGILYIHIYICTCIGI